MQDPDAIYELRMYKLETGRESDSPARRTAACLIRST